MLNPVHSSTFTYSERRIGIGYYRLIHVHISIGNVLIRKVLLTQYIF